MSIMENLIQTARVFRRSAEMKNGFRPVTLTEIKTVSVVPAAIGESKVLAGETYSPVTKYALFAPSGAGLEYFDELRLNDGRVLIITSAHPTVAPSGGMTMERYSAEERKD